ncbi:MAG: hypothetical protein KC502_23825, partial [Myxococcales bacterium]|nr:hypothetical protein [Myxococcales bacterium]
NGKAPEITADCNSSHGLATAALKEKELGYVLNDYLYCKDGKFDWSLKLYPGTYEIWVGGFDPSSSSYYNKSDLRTLQQRVYGAMKLNNDAVGLVLDYKLIPVEGTILRNGTTPTITAGCKSSDGIAKVQFIEPTLSYYFSRYLYCKDGKFDWDDDIYPGTYEVWVAGYNPPSSSYYNKSNMGTLMQRIYSALKIQ